MKFNLKKVGDAFRKFKEVHKLTIGKAKEFLLVVLAYGLILNYMFAVLTRTPFLWYGFPAFGIAYYFITEEFVSWFRKLKAKTFA